MPLIEDLIFDIPPLTRVMCLSSVVLTVLTYLEFVTPYNLYFNLKLIIQNF